MKTSSSSSVNKRIEIAFVVVAAVATFIVAVVPYTYAKKKRVSKIVLSKIDKIVSQ